MEPKVNWLIDMTISYDAAFNARVFVAVVTDSAVVVIVVVGTVVIVYNSIGATFVYKR